MAETPGLWINNQICLLDWRGQVEEFMGEHLPLEWVQPGPNVNRRLETGSRLSIPQYREPPPLGINQAYWPTGAIRWAYGYLLLGKTQAEAISQETAVPFRFASETYGIQTQVYALRPHPVNAWKDDTSGEFGDCFIVPFVDKRYYWQFKEVDLSDETDKNTTWQDLINKIATALGETSIVVEETIDAKYLKPDWSLLTFWNNAAAALDSIAHSIGRRVVVKWDGTVKLETYGQAFSETSSSFTAYKNNQFRAGGSPQATRPRIRDAKILYRKAWNHLPACSESYYLEWINLHTSPNGVEDTAWLVNSTAWANYNDQNTSNPENLTELQQLADVISLSLEAWNRTSFDYSFHGCVPWEQTGLVDYQVHNYGTELSRPELFDPAEPGQPAELRTDWRRSVNVRVVSFPHNFYAKTQLSRSADVYEGDQITVRMNEDLTPGQTGKQATIVTWDKANTTWINGPVIKIDDYWPSPGSVYGGVCALANEVLQVRNRGIYPGAFEDPNPTDANACQTIAAISYGLVRDINIVNDISPGSTGTGRIIRADNSNGPTVTVKNGSLTDILEAGGNTVGVYHRHDGLWYSTETGGGGGGPGVSGDLIPVQAYDFIQPGGSGQAYIMEWSETDPCIWAPTAQLVTIHDVIGQSCLVPGEEVWVQKRETTCDSQPLDRYEIIGSHGLRRRVKADTDAPCGSFGNALIMGEDGQASPGECDDGEPTVYILSVCNRWGTALQNVYAGDQAWAQYDLQKKIWFYAEMDEPELAKATVAMGSGGCQSGDPKASINIQGFQYTTKLGASCNLAPDTTPAQVVNPLLLPMRDGDQVELRRNNLFPPDHPTSGWEITQVQPHQHHEVSDAGWTGDCPTLQFARKKIWAYSCDDEVDNVLTTAAGTVPVNNVRFVTFDQSGDNCRLAIDNSTICVPPGGTVDATTYPLSATKIELVKNVVEGSAQLDQTKQEVGVLCPGDEATTKILDFYDCPDPPPDNVSDPV